MLDLGELLDASRRNLSGGQRQRVAMGRAIVREPQAFLMDEPLSNLDAKLRVQMRAEIARLQQRLGATMVYVTHDQVEAMTLGDRIAVHARRRRSSRSARPTESTSTRANLFVAGFIGSPPMNFLPARVEDGAVKLPVATCRLERRAALHGSSAGASSSASAPRTSRTPRWSPNRPGATMTADVDVLESTGSDRFAHIALDHSEAAEAQRAAAELNPDARDVPLPTEIVARLGSGSRIREGGPGTLWIDTSKLHLFDAATGERL